MTYRLSLGARTLRRHKWEASYATTIGFGGLDIETLESLIVTLSEHANGDIVFLICPESDTQSSQKRANSD